MQHLRTQIEVAAHWLNEAAFVVLDDELRANLKRVRHECLAAAAGNDNARPLVAPQQDGGEARSASYTYDKDGAVVGGITRGYYD